MEQKRRMTPEERRAARVDSTMKWRSKRIAKGVCVRCGAKLNYPEGATKINCEKCVRRGYEARVNTRKKEDAQTSNHAVISVSHSDKIAIRNFAIKSGVSLTVAMSRILIAAKIKKA